MGEDKTGFESSLELEPFHCSSPHILQEMEGQGNTCTGVHSMHACNSLESYRKYHVKKLCIQCFSVLFLTTHSHSLTKPGTVAIHSYNLHNLQDFTVLIICNIHSDTDKSNNR